MNPSTFKSKKIGKSSTPKPIPSAIYEKKPMNPTGYSVPDFNSGTISKKNVNPKNNTMAGHPVPKSTNRRTKSTAAPTGEPHDMMLNKLGASPIGTSHKIL